MHPRDLKHVCHQVGQTHDPCLVDTYHLYIGLVKIFGKGIGVSIFSQMQKNVINSLNQILPDMCKAAVLRRKTAHCLCVTCASNLFNARVDSKLICDRTGHRSDALCTCHWRSIKPP